MPNYPCQDCGYLVKYISVFDNKSHMQRTCVAKGIECVHQNAAFPCKRTNCKFWEHGDSVNGIAWCEQCWQRRGPGDVLTLSCAACMAPSTFDPYDEEEFEMLEGRGELD